MKFSKLLFSLVICFAVATAGSAVTVPAIMSWYTTLHKPFFTPPNYVFGPVWTLLYLFMAIALAIVWSKKKAAHALQFFFLQLGLNLLWSVVFFGLQQPFAGLIVIVLLWFAIAKTIKDFASFSQVAAYLLAPYLIWVSYATLLNLAIVVLNF